MVHTVEILGYRPRTDRPGALEFKLNATTYHAKCYADPQLANGLIVVGEHYPVSVFVEADDTAEYGAADDSSLELLEQREEGDIVRAKGRTWDSISHDTVLLNSTPAVALKVKLPQQATDFRGGSSLVATGILCVDLPPEDHD